ncbi:hypothetical protein D3C75_1107280 [compost metagenome]
MDDNNRLITCFTRRKEGPSNRIIIFQTLELDLFVGSFINIQFVADISVSRMVQQGVYYFIRYKKHKSYHKQKHDPQAP